MLLRGELAGVHEVGDDLVQVGVHALVDAEAQAQLDLEQEVRAVVVHDELVRVRLVRDHDVQEVVCAGALGALVQDGVEDVAVQLVRRGVVGEEDEVVRDDGVVVVVAKGAELVDVLVDGQVHGLGVLDRGAAAPHVHDDEDERRHEDGEVAAVEELRERGEEERELDRAEEQREDNGKPAPVPQLGDVGVEKDRGHEHGDRDGQAVGGLHVAGAAEQQHDEHARDPHDGVDHGNVDLALRLRGEVDLHVRHEVEVDGLAHDGVGAGDERLRGDDGGECGEDDLCEAEVLRHDLEERVEVGRGRECRIALVCEDPGALAQVVEDEAELHERPGRVDVGLADVAHVRVEGLRAGGAQEDVAKDHEAGGVDGAVEQEADAAQRVERAEDVEVEADVQQAGDSEEQEPDGHDGTERLADGGGAGALHGKQHAQDDDGDGHDDVLVGADDGVERVDGAQALDRGGDGDRRREDAVREEGGAADHGGEDEPLSAAADEGVQREDATLVVVVGLHGDEDVLDGGDERERPDDERERAQDRVLTHGGETAVVRHDRLERVHGAGADVAVDDAQCDEDHARGQRDAVVPAPLGGYTLWRCRQLRVRHSAPISM